MPHNLNIKADETIYKYKLKQRIGGGSFGQVWLAEDQTISREVAVKILPENATIDARLKEARIGNCLEHANLVKMHYADVVRHNNTNLVIIAMDYHAEGSIISKLNAANFMQIPKALSTTRDILRGLEYLHENNLFHNDIKPQNILMGATGQGILTDYGISCVSSEGEPVHHEGFYKCHVAPETLTSNNVNSQTDVYQVGLTLFRLISSIGAIKNTFEKCGESKFNERVKNGKIISTNDYHFFVPQSLKKIINKAITPLPNKRYKSALDMRRALERINYKGYWTTDESGNYIGHQEKYEFRFQVNTIGHNLFDFMTFKKNKETNREVKISAYKGKKLSPKQLESLKKRFTQWVVTG